MALGLAMVAAGQSDRGGRDESRRFPEAARTAVEALVSELSGH